MTTRAPTSSAAGGVTLCRGCCCGTAKIPGVDHTRQITTLRRMLSDVRVRVRTSPCLGPCKQGNVVVVHPSAEARRKGATTVWLGLVNDDSRLRAIAEWVRAGGADDSRAPAELESLTFTPSVRGGKRT